LCLVTVKNGDRNLLGGMESLKSVQAVSIHPLSKNKVLVLDSSGLLERAVPPKVRCLYIEVLVHIYRSKSAQRLHRGGQSDCPGWRWPGNPNNMHAPLGCNP
jgi:hypothetical protein